MSKQLKKAMAKAVAFSIKTKKETGIQVAIDFSPHRDNNLWFSLYDADGEMLSGLYQYCKPVDIERTLARIRVSIQGLHKCS